MIAAQAGTALASALCAATSDCEPKRFPGKITDFARPLERARGPISAVVRIVPTPLLTRPFRAVLLWQAAATLVVAVIAGSWAGFDGALSAVLGGVINLSAGIVDAFGLAIAPPKSAGATIVALFRAEAAKILVIIGLMWLVLSTYHKAVLPALLAAFIVTVLLFRVALLIRD
jgi:ATP synthase protein I